MTHGAHFVVNTAQNGQGPLLNKHPPQQGVEDLCNPPGRGLGPRPTTSTGFPHVDAFLWTHVPGNSSGSCNGGPPSGDVLARATRRGSRRARTAASARATRASRTDPAHGGPPPGVLSLRS